MSYIPNAIFVDKDDISNIRRLLHELPDKQADHVASFLCFLFERNGIDDINDRTKSVSLGFLDIDSLHQGDNLYRELKHRSERYLETLCRTAPPVCNTGGANP